jgi:hypothetical protein
MSLDRTAEHERWEREAAEWGFPYPLPIRTLLVTIAGVKYRIPDAITSWHAVDGDSLCCTRCQQPLTSIGPNFLHDQAIVSCRCRASYLVLIE